jgi:hypothetical protein
LKQASCFESERLSPAQAMTYARGPGIVRQINVKEEVDYLFHLHSNGFRFGIEVNITGCKQHF